MGVTGRRAVPRAGDALAITAGALEEVERASLVKVVDMLLTFRHPLVRSAAYSTASPGERRAAHHALADVVGEERRPWHLAAAALGPDEDIPQALERLAEGARGRSGYAGAAAALERAALLSPEEASRARRVERQ